MTTGIASAASATMASTTSSAPSDCQPVRDRVVAVPGQEQRHEQTSPETPAIHSPARSLRRSMRRERTGAAVPGAEGPRGRAAGTARCGRGERPLALVLGGGWMAAGRSALAEHMSKRATRERSQGGTPANDGG